MSHFNSWVHLSTKAVAPVHFQRVGQVARTSIQLRLCHLLY